MRNGKKAQKGRPKPPERIQSQSTRTATRIEAKQLSTKSGKRSSAQKGSTSRSSGPIAPAKPKAGAFGASGGGPPQDPPPSPERLEQRKRERKDRTAP